MSRSPTLALHHILDGIDLFRSIVSGRTRSELIVDRVGQAAAERAIEILSEASRRIPDGWKAQEPDIPWRRIADIGNVIRHQYEDVSVDELLDLHDRGHVDRLEEAVRRLLDRYDRETPT